MPDGMALGRDPSHQYGMALVAYSPVAKGRIKNNRTLAQIGQAHGRLVQQNVAAIPRTSRIERLSENIDIFDFVLSEEEMRQISPLGSAKVRLTDFGFARNGIETVAVPAMLAAGTISKNVD